MNHRTFGLTCMAVALALTWAVLTYSAVSTINRPSGIRQAK